MDWNTVKPIPLDHIKIPGRIRQERGDIDEMAQSIQTRGLIHPISVMANEDGTYTLLGGMRRLLAARALDWREILATVFPPSDAEEALQHEFEENVKRKDFTHAERLQYAAKYRIIERAKSQMRQEATQIKDGHAPVVDHHPSPDGTIESEKGKTRDIVAKIVGYGSGRQLERVETIAENRPELIAKIDSGEMSVNAAYVETKGAHVPESDEGHTPFAFSMLNEIEPGIEDDEPRDVPSSGLEWKTVYISSTYEIPTKKKSQEAQKASYIKHSWFAFEECVIPLSAHELFRWHLQEDDPEQRQLGLELGLNLLHRCDELWVFGLKVDDDMAREIAEAESIDIPVRYFNGSHQEINTSEQPTQGGTV